MRQWQRRPQSQRVVLPQMVWSCGRVSEVRGLLNPLTGKGGLTDVCIVTACGWWGVCAVWVELNVQAFLASVAHGPSNDRDEACGHVCGRW